MTHYRKNKNGREFFSINGDYVTKVLNKEYRSFVDVMKSLMMANAVMGDTELYKPCTEEEFNSAYKEAFDRIALRKIV